LPLRVTADDRTAHREFVRTSSACSIAEISPKWWHANVDVKVRSSILLLMSKHITLTIFQFER